MDFAIVRMYVHVYLPVFGFESEGTRKRGGQLMLEYGQLHGHDSDQMGLELVDSYQ